MRYALVEALEVNEYGNRNTHLVIMPCDGALVPKRPKIGYTWDTDDRGSYCQVLSTHGTEQLAGVAYWREYYARR